MKCDDLDGCTRAFLEAEYSEQMETIQNNPGAILPVLDAYSCDLNKESDDYMEVVNKSYEFNCVCSTIERWARVHGIDCHNRFSHVSELYDYFLDPSPCPRRGNKPVPTEEEFTQAFIDTIPLLCEIKEHALYVSRTSAHPARPAPANEAQDSKMRPPLSRQQELVLAEIPEYDPTNPRGITGSKIIECICKKYPDNQIDQSYLTRHVIPFLKAHYGVENPKRKGYMKRSF